MDSGDLAEEIDRTRRGMERILHRPAEQRGRWVLSDSGVITDGTRFMRITGWQRSPDGNLLAQLDVDGQSQTIPFDVLCRNTERYAPASGTGRGLLAEPDDVVWFRLPAEVRADAVSMARHLVEVETGSPDGNLARARLLGRVRPEYDPVLQPSKRKRIQAKIVELTALGFRGVTEKSLYRKGQHMRERGLMGLVDDRTARHHAQPLPAADEAVRAAVQDAIARRQRGARVADEVLRSLVRIALTNQGLGADLTDAELGRLIREYSRNKGFHRDFRSRMTKSNRPRDLYGRIVASRPGEIVQIDATPANIHVWSPIAEWGNAVILTAIDTFDRQILGLRVVPQQLTTRDTALLLWDMSKPDVYRRGLPYALRRWPGPPSLVVIDAEHTRLANERQRIGPKASRIPSMVVVDHGREFDADHFLSACERNGIGVIFARPHVATDKGIVESWHSTLDTFLSGLPGYKGANPRNHPDDAAADACLTVHDLYDALWTWIIECYHERPHKGLRDRHNPNIKVSPNMAFDRYLQAGGHLEIQEDPWRAISFLSCQQRHIQDGGQIEMNNIIYASEDTRRLREHTARGVGAPAVSTSVFYDRWDLSRIWIHDELNQRWICVPEHNPTGAITHPFSEAIRNYAQHQARRGQQPTTAAARRELRTRVWAEFASGKFADRRERRLWATEHDRNTTHAADIADWDDVTRRAAFPPEPPRKAPALIGYEFADADDEYVDQMEPGPDDGLAW